jgi:multidrug efflux pump subunit AcrB
MWIVRLALRRPYTFVVAALLLLLITPFVLTKTPTDIFPAINIPVVSVIWSYTGLPADQIAQRLVYSEERALTTTHRLKAARCSSADERELASRS